MCEVDDIYLFAIVMGVSTYYENDDDGLKTKKYLENKGRDYSRAADI